MKDIDIDQYEEIVIPPTAAIDLIYFDLSSEDFSPSPGGNLRAVDDTRLEFLDDDYIQNGLTRADLNFRFINSFQSAFTANLLFRSENNAIQYQVLIDVPAGSSTSPAVVNYTEIIHEQIESLKRSIKVSVEIIMQDSSQAGSGDLQLESKGTYYFEFK